MGLLGDFVKRQWERGDREDLQSQVQGLIGQAPSPQFKQMSEQGVPVEEYIASKRPMDVRAGTGALETGQLDVQKLAQGLIGVPETQAIGAQMIRDLMPSPTKPTGLMQNLAMAGVDFNTPEGKKIMLDAVMKPDTQINMGQKAIPVTDLMKMRMPDGSRPPVGITHEQAQQLGVTLHKDVSSDAASKLAMIDTAKQGIQDIKPIMFNPDGTINRGIIKEAWGIGVAEPVAGLVSPEAGKLFAGFEYGIQAITRAETGAAMPATEIDNTRKRFMPKPWDSDEVVNQKWSAYNLFLNNAKKYIDPKAAKSGNWNKAINFDALMMDAKNNEPSGKIGETKPKTVRFEDL